eukprot:302991_1
MAQAAKKETVSLLKVNNKGWKVDLFKDQNAIIHDLCENCGSVCCDPVELGCDHKDDDIYLYCRQCLSQLIADNNGKCTVDGHSDPVIIASRATRKKISKAIVYCPYSIQYKTVIKEVINNNGNVIDTLGADEKEGVQPQLPLQNENKISLHKSACLWKGSLNDLINNHISECTKKHNPSFALNIQIKELKQENILLENKVNDQSVQIDQFRRTLELQENNIKQQYATINKSNQKTLALHNEIKSKEEKNKSDEKIIHQLQNEIKACKQENQQIKTQLNEQMKLLQDIIVSREQHDDNSGLILFENKEEKKNNDNKQQNKQNNFEFDIPKECEHKIKKT